MSSVAATIQELFESGQSPRQICKLLKGRASRSGVYKALKRFRETGSTLPKVRSTPDRIVRTPKLIKNTREKIRRNPERSIRKLASASGVSYGTMHKVLRSDLNLSPFKKTKVQILSKANKNQTAGKSKASSSKS